jgi:NTE family protein
MASTSVDAGAIIGGIVLPGSIADRVVAAYAKTLFGDATLQDLPDDTDGKAPRFVINATNVQTGALWRFSRRYMGDYRVGLVPRPTTKLAVAVAASSAFPPILSPLELTVAQPWDPTVAADLTGPEFRNRIVLSDGGVYDNLGLETVFKRYRTVLVSDAGQKIEAEANPDDDWARHSIRIMNITDNQVRSLRKIELIDAYERGDHDGAYWGIRTRFADYHLAADPLGCAGRDPTGLAEIPTRLAAMPAAEQDALINWGYAITDAALRAHFGPALQKQYGVTIAAPKGFPCPGGY